eukprot:comp17903_c0_seq1/m.31054 comp17903_c0_seq1/g.31054  ORF comp17903_c0_seq1/g.31054 comp17903_c0_seq1/m.31054 type:complete len:379 (-) comp17903_c0_seq1:170-1306(-)
MQRIATEAICEHLSHGIEPNNVAREAIHKQTRKRPRGKIAPTHTLDAVRRTAGLHRTHPRLVKCRNQRPAQNLPVVEHKHPVLQRADQPDVLRIKVEVRHEIVDLGNLADRPALARHNRTSSTTTSSSSNSTRRGRMHSPALQIAAPVILNITLRPTIPRPGRPLATAVRHRTVKRLLAVLEPHPRPAALGNQLRHLTRLLPLSLLRMRASVLARTIFGQQLRSTRHQLLERLARKRVGLDQPLLAQIITHRCVWIDNNLEPTASSACASACAACAASATPASAAAECTAHARRHGRSAASATHARRFCGRSALHGLDIGAQLEIPCAVARQVLGNHHPVHTERVVGLPGLEVLHAVVELAVRKHLVELEPFLETDIV